MNKEDIPVPVILTRDQIRMLRAALIATDETTHSVLWDYAKSRVIRDLLNTAEIAATINHARRDQTLGAYSPQRPK